MAMRSVALDSGAQWTARLDGGAITNVRTALRLRCSAPVSMMPAHGRTGDLPAVIAVAYGLKTAHVATFAPSRWISPPFPFPSSRRKRHENAASGSAARAPYHRPGPRGNQGDAGHLQRRRNHDEGFRRVRHRQKWQATGNRHRARVVGHHEAYP